MKIKAVQQAGLAGMMAALISALSCSYVPMTPAEDSLNDGLIPTSLVANYNISTVRVNLSWTAPTAQQPAAYSVYRTSITLADGSADTTDMLENGYRGEVAGNLTTFTDVPGLSNTTYHYGIRAVVLRPDYTDASHPTMVVVEGPLSDLATCEVISARAFSINLGDVFLTIDTCDLRFVDRQHEADSITITDTAYYFMDVDTITPSPLKTETSFVWVPVFLPANSRNSQITYPLNNDSVRTIRWTLPKGSGAKRLSARVYLKSNALDTMMDDIQIRPYRVDIKIRNNMNAVDPEMKKGFVTEMPLEDEFTIFRRWVNFSIAIFADSTFDKDSLSYWLVLPDTGYKLGASPSARTAWLETQPQFSALTGSGAKHNDLFIYQYSIDINTPTGASNLSTLRKSVALTNEASKYQVSELAKPGSYWGDSIDSKNSKIWATIKNSPSRANTPEENFKIISSLGFIDKFNRGRKEVAIVVRLKGRYFGDTRSAVSSLWVSRTTGDNVTYFDFTPPLINANALEGYWHNGTIEFPIEGSTIYGNFSVVFSSVIDRAGSPVAKIQLIMAEMPSAMAENWDKNVGRTLSIDSILSFRHRIMDFDVASDSTTVQPVFWRSIDPSGWTSGDYLIGYITEDKAGNKGLAPMLEKAGGGTFNPCHVRIITGH